MGGAPIGEALRQTRVSLAREIGEGTTPWGAYALYGDPRTVYAASAGRVAAPRRATRLAPRPRRQDPKIRRAEAAPAAVAARARRHPWADALEFAGVLVLIVALTAAALWWLLHGAPARFENFPESAAP